MLIETLLLTANMLISNFKIFVFNRLTSTSRLENWGDEKK